MIPSKRGLVAKSGLIQMTGGCSIVIRVWKNVIKIWEIELLSFDLENCHCRSDTLQLFVETRDRLDRTKTQAGFFLLLNIQKG